MKRNLLFHLYPQKGSIWPWHIDQLLKYKDVWNGRKVITVAMDHLTEDEGTVRSKLDSLGAEIFCVDNDPILGETRHFVNQLGLLSSPNENEATFYAHAKGVTLEGSELEAVKKWCEAMYVLNLECLPAVETALSHYGAVGCFRHFVSHAGSLWSYGGTFFWLKHSVIFSRKWEEIEKTRYGVEGYPGRHLDWREMRAFTPDNVGPRWLYKSGVTDAHIEEWKRYWRSEMHGSVMEYLTEQVLSEEIRGKDVLEVGSYNVNGTPRTIFMALEPKKYLGVDQENGPGVDYVVNASNLIEQLGKESFDVVVSTEMLEHAKDWKTAVNSMKTVLKLGGLLYITTRGPGFPYHGFPDDHWRFTVPDFEKIFADMEILDLRPDHDPKLPGVFLKAKKPVRFLQTDLSKIEVGLAPPRP